MILHYTSLYFIILLVSANRAPLRHHGAARRRGGAHGHAWLGGGHGGLLALDGACAGAVARHAHADCRALVGTRRRHRLLQRAGRSVRHQGLHAAPPTALHPHPHATPRTMLHPLPCCSPSPCCTPSPCHTPLPCHTLTLTILRQVCVWSVAGNGMPMAA